MIYFEDNNILNHRHHAFRRNPSCERQLTTDLNDWAVSLDNNKLIVPYWTFEKALYAVPHELLKLICISMDSGLAYLIIRVLVYTFLSNRKQCVVVNGVKSKFADILSGMPQGTVLESILLLAHIH